MSTSVLVLDNFEFSPLFFISLIIAIIFIYDAVGPRYQLGKQAKAINELNGKLKIKDDTHEYVELKESIGHKWYEIIAGAVWGISLALLVGFLVIS
jgi:acid phosphatase family membrane protein YuiD